MKGTSVKFEALFSFGSAKEIVLFQKQKHILSIETLHTTENFRDIFLCFFLLPPGNTSFFFIVSYIVDKYQQIKFVQRSTRALPLVNIPEFTCNLCMLLWFAMAYSVLEIKNVSFIVIYRGAQKNSVTLRYMGRGRERAFHENGQNILHMKLVSIKIIS